MKTSDHLNIILAIIACSALLTLTPGCSNGAAQWDTVKTDFKGLPSSMLDDGKKLVTTPENAVILIAGGGASAYVRCAHDDQIADHFEHHDSFPRDFNIGAATIGSPVSHFSVTGLAYLYSLNTENTQLHDVSFRMFEALSVTGILTTGLKFAANDYGPNGEKYAWPSGHTSSAVAFATVLNEFYGPLVGVPLYGLCGFAMYERMEDGEHWASDVVFGAALGYVVGKTVADKYKPEIFGFKVTPWLDPVNGGTGIALAKSF